MYERTIESTTIDTQDVPIEWTESGPNIFSSHAQNVANLVKSQPTASTGGVELFIPPNVYHPGIGLSSSLLVDTLLNEGIEGIKWDLGCGSGFVGISLYPRGNDNA